MKDKEKIDILVEWILISACPFNCILEGKHPGCKGNDCELAEDVLKEIGIDFQSKPPKTKVKLTKIHKLKNK